MKKFIAILMVAMLVVSLAACGAGGDGDTTVADSTTVESKVESSNNAVNAEDSPVGILNAVWATYADSEKFPGAGGDEANQNMEGPGAYGLEDVEGFTAITHFPAESIAKIDSAATLMHMMNANTMTVAAYHVVEGTDMAVLADEVEASVMATQWMCGFPEKLVIVTVDDYMISYFGNGEVVDTFTGKLTAAYASAEVVVDADIVA